MVNLIFTILHRVPLLLRGWLRYKVLTSVTLALMAAGLFTSMGQAHAKLVRSDPADGAILSESPREIRMWFDEPISTRFSSAQLFDVNSKPIEIEGVSPDAADPTLLVVSLPDLPEGTYSILWKILSETDGHFNQGMLVFGFGQGAVASSAAVSAPEAQAPPLAEVLLRWSNFTLMAAMVGAAAMVQLVLSPAVARRSADARTSGVLSEARRRIIFLALVCSGLALLIGLALMLWQSFTLLQSLPEGVPFSSVVGQLLGQTRWGKLWLVRQFILLITGGLLVVIYRRAGRRLKEQAPLSNNLLWLVLDLSLLALLTVQSLGSHAAGLSSNGTLALVADVLHLLAASLWLGGLLALAVGLLPLIRRHRAEAKSLIQAGWKPFSLVAAVSVGLLAATGLYSAGRLVASPDALLTTLYGRALLGKIGLVLIVGAFGLLNSMLLHPGLATPLARLLRRPDGWTPLPLSRLPLLVVAEISLGLMVLLATGLVTASEAPRGAEFTIAADDVPGSLSQTVDDMVITLTSKPNRPGQNVFTVFASSTRRPAPAEISRVILRFSYKDQETGRVSADAEEVEPGRFLLGGSYLSLAGNWQVDVVVRRLGLEDSVAHFDWTVAPPGQARPVVFSNIPLEPILTLAAAGVILLILLVVLLIWLRGHRVSLRRQAPERPATMRVEPSA